MDFAQARFYMVEQQVRTWDVFDARVLKVIGDLPRERFVPREYQKLAYADTTIPLTAHSKMLKPNIVGRILQHLALTPDDLVLEIGTGSGYLTACIASLARHVDSVEVDEELVETAEANIKALGLDNVNIAVGDASHGWSQKRFYSAIVITASMPEAPEQYMKMLAEGGRLFVVTGDAPAMTAQLITRTGKNKWVTEDLFETSIDRLTGTEKTPEESFAF